MKSIILIFFLTMTVVSCESKSSDRHNTNPKNAKVESWQSSLTEGSYLALDVRTKGEVEANSAQGSINIPMGELGNKVNELDKSKKILVFCEAGGRASRVKTMLMEKGFANVINIGSWREWNAFYQNK